MNNKSKFISLLLVALFGASYSSANNTRTLTEANTDENLVVRHVLRQNAANEEGTIINATAAPAANNLVSDVLAQVNAPLNGKVSMRFVAGIDTYTYSNAQFNITLKDAEGSVVKAERSYAVSSAYVGVEADGEVKYAADLFGEGYNYLIAYTLSDIPEDYWNYKFDVTASIGETGSLTTSTNVNTKVAASMLDYNLKVNLVNVDGTNLGTRYEKVTTDAIYTYTAPSFDGLVASHDYVKGYLTGEDKDTVNIYYSEVDTWDGTASSGFTGAGTENEPYLISSAEDFALLRANAEAGTTYEGSYFKMTKSVDFGGENFIVSSFAGYFDGNNCSVRGLNLDMNDYTGLFSKTTAGEIKNVSTYGEVYGWGTVGSIVGQADGTLTNITNYATVNGQGTRGGIVGRANAKVTDCVNYGDSLARSGGWTVAGVVGESNAEIEGLKNFGKVTGSTTHVAGVVATANASVTRCENYGYVTDFSIGAAGVVANATAGVISYCVNRGDLFQNFTTSSWTGSVGGVVGKGSNSSIAYCENYGNLNITITDQSKTTGIGGVVGTNASAIIDNCVNHGNLTTNQKMAGGVVGDAVCAVSNSKNYGTIESTSGSNGGVIGKLQKANVTNCENYGEVIGTNTIAGIVAAIPWISGALRTISNCTNYGTIRNSSYFGGGIAGTVNQANIVDCENRGDILATGDNCGGIAAILYNTGTITNCHNYADVQGKTNIGGIVSQNGSTISNCSNAGNIIVTTSTGAADENGITGINSVTASGKTYPGTITDCTNTGSIIYA